MNKKQRNRKIVTQNNRNRLINRRYSTTIKTLSKLFASKIDFLNNLRIIDKALKMERREDAQVVQLKVEAAEIITKLYSIIDKAVKKGVIHKNTAARKKSKVVKTLINS
jgi:small subunit ribosomal protein S20